MERFKAETRFAMPVRSLTTSVLRWPDRRAVERGAVEWAAREAPRHPGLLRLGYFGSYARGDAGVGSDLDLVAVVESSPEPFERRALDWDLSSLPIPRSSSSTHAWSGNGSSSRAAALYGRCSRKRAGFGHDVGTLSIHRDGRSSVRRKAVRKKGRRLSRTSRRPPLARPAGRRLSRSACSRGSPGPGSRRRSSERSHCPGTRCPTSCHPGTAPCNSCRLRRSRREVLSTGNRSREPFRGRAGPWPGELPRGP